MDDDLWIDSETMRALGYRTVDLLVDHLADPRAHHVIRRATREEMEGRVGGEPSEEGRPFEDLLASLRDDVLPFMARSEHPGYLAFVPSCGTWPGALGDFVASATNAFAGSWMESSGPTQLELTVLDWFRSWVGFPPEAAGILLSGGSAANMTALACAREALLGPMSDAAVAYISDQAHSSLARAARVLGFRPDQVRVLPTDRRFRMSPESLSEAMDLDLAAGRRPLFVAASAGSTNTGAVDPLRELAHVCRDRGVWFHVDAAYGGFATLTDRGRAGVDGIDLADSLTLDPHKWLFQPFECGCLLVREGHLLRRAFEITPDYLQDLHLYRREINLSDFGLQLTRASRAFKVWLSIEHFGLARFRAAIDRALDLAEHAEERIAASDHLELLAPRSLGIVCFRRSAAGMAEVEIDRWNAALVDAVEATGAALVSSTRLRGRYAVRMCVLNHTTERRDIDHVLDLMEATEPALLTTPPPRELDRHPDATQGWLGRKRPVPDHLRRHELLASLNEAQLSRVAAAAHEQTVGDGNTILRRWESTRELYVVLEGAVEVLDGERSLARIEAGGFFGELAAIDWGAGFGYPRLATVIARSQTRLLVVPALLLNQLMQEAPAFQDRIRLAVQERLPNVEPGA